MEEQKRARDGQDWGADEQAAFKAAISQRYVCAPSFVHCALRCFYRCPHLCCDSLALHLGFAQTRGCRARDARGFRHALHGNALLEAMSTPVSLHVPRYDSEGEPEYASARLWDDGVIDPADTRRVLSLAFAAACNGYSAVQPRYGVFRM